MAKTSSIEKNNRRRKMAAQYGRQAQALEGDRQRSQAPGRRALRGASEAGRDAAQFVSNAHPQPLRAHRPRARHYRKFKLCRNQLRELASQGRIPGIVKSSW